MDRYPSPSYETLPCDLPHDREITNRHHFLQNLGERIINSVSRLATIGATAAAVFAAGPSISQAAKIKPEATQLTYSSSGEANETNCTQVDDFPLGYYMGQACSSDIEYKLWDSYPKGFDYAVLVVDGIYKCGWVKSGILNAQPASSATKGAGFCEANSHSLTRDPYKLIYNLNCAPGTCQDGRKDQLTQPCNEYGNFASSTKSVLNIFPDGNNDGFSDFIVQQGGSIYYRGTLVPTSSSGDAIDVRNDTTGWGLMREQCDPQNS